MKKTYVVSTLCALLVLFLTGSALAQIVPGCARASDETTRVATARAVLEVNAANYASYINYWADDVEHREPVFTNNGRQEMLDYLDGYYSGSNYGWPDDRVVIIKDEIAKTLPDGSMTYVANLQWTGTSAVGFYFQTGMAIIKFRPGEGCPYYHRDYFNEVDNWYQVPAWKADAAQMRGIYILIFGLTGRCFDDDQDGYTKYIEATGCPNAGLDCNDFTDAINPDVEERTAAGNCADGIDNDCDGWIDAADPGCS